MYNKHYAWLIACFLLVGNNAYSSFCLNKNLKELANKEVLTDDEKWETETIRAFLKKNGYKEPSQQAFNDRCLYLFGVNLPKVPQTNLRYIRTMETDYTLNEFGRFIYPEVENLFYQPEIDRDITREDAKRLLENKEAGIGSKIVAYNKMMYNDDASALPYFRKEPDFAVEVVFSFNYEANQTLTKRAIEYAHLSNIIADNTEAILFYNNKKRGVRKYLIAQIYEHCSKNRDDFKDFEKIVLTYFNDFEQLKYDVNVKDQCLVYLISLLSDYDNKNKAAILEQGGSKAFQHLSNFLSEYPALESRLKAQNFYNDNKLKELVKNIEDQNKEAVSANKSKGSNYKIYDPDGYCNLREQGNKTARVIQQVPSGSSIRVLETNNNWWKVVTNDGKTGFIHKSRIVKSK